MVSSRRFFLIITRFKQKKETFKVPYLFQFANLHYKRSVWTWRNASHARGILGFIIVSGYRWQAPIVPNKYVLRTRVQVVQVPVLESDIYSYNDYAVFVLGRKWYLLASWFEL